MIGPNDPTAPTRRAGDDHTHPLLEHRLAMVEHHVNGTMVEVQKALVRLARGDEVLVQVQNEIREMKHSIEKVVDGLAAGRKWSIESWIYLSSLVAASIVVGGVLMYLRDVIDK